MEQSLLKATLFAASTITIFSLLVESISSLLLTYAFAAYNLPNLTDEDLRDSVKVVTFEDTLSGLEPDLNKQKFRSFMTEFQPEFVSLSIPTQLLGLSPGDYDGISFLGEYWYLAPPCSPSIPYRTALDTYLRLLYPEDGIAPDPADTYLRLIFNYMDATGNPEMKQWI